MRPLRNFLLAAAGLGLLSAGTAWAQEQSTRVIHVPQNAVVLVLPAGTRVLAPGGMPDAVAFAGPSRLERMVRDMDARMAALFDDEGAAPMAPFAMPPGLVQVMTTGMPMDMPQSGVSSVVIQTVSDGTHSCTRRIVSNGQGDPVVQTSGDDCGALMRGPTPAAQPALVPSAPAPRLIEAANHRPAQRHLLEVAAR